MCAGREMWLWSKGGLGELEFHAAVCIILVRECTAMSISFSDFRRVFKFIFSLRIDWNLSQLIIPLVRDG